MQYIDTHSHILPAVDDGPADIAAARAMLRIAYDEGIRTVIATPHFHPFRGRADQDILSRRLAMVREEAFRIGTDFKIFLGNELFLLQDSEEKLVQKKVLTMNGTDFVLTEFLPDAAFDHIKQGIVRLQMKGYRVLLAHAERYTCIRASMDNAEQLVDMGVKIQINTGSITGAGGWKLKKTARSLLMQNLVFCVGTDAHDAVKRAPRMKKAAEYVSRNYGEEYMRQIFCRNAKALLRREME